MSDLLDRLAPVDATYTLAKQATDLQLHQQSNTPLEARLAPVDLNAGPTTSATASWAATRRYRQAQGYRDLMNLAALDSQTDPARKAEEEAKIQVSMYLADRMQAEPKDVYLSWDSQGHSPIAEAYFKQTDLPISYRKRAANEIDRAAKTYQQLNLMSGQYFSGSFDPAVFAKWQALEDSKPPADVRERGAGHWLADIPLTFIQQAPYILDMGAGELAGGVLGGAIGTLIGPEGTAAGFAIGRRVGGAVEAARTGAAQIFQNIMTMPDPETGKPLYQVVKDPAQLASIARWAASVGGVLTAVPATVGMEAILGKAPEFFAQLGLKAIATEGQKGVFRSAFGQFLQKYGKNVGLQMMNMPVQNVVMQISQDASAADANTQLGTNLPLASLKEYGQLIAEGVNVGLQTGLPLSLFGSIREARGAMERITAAESRVKAQAELKSFETMADTARPAAERIAEIGATRADVQAKVDALKPQLDALDQVKDPKEVQRITKEYDAAATKLAVLDFLQKDAEASAPDAAWKNTRTQWQATQPAEALAPSSASPLLELDSPVVQTIKEGLPKLSDEQAQGAALYAKLLADRVGQNLDDYIGQRFVTGIFDATKAKELEAGGHWGAISWDEAGKAIFYTTEHSNFSTWTHELTHMFERDLTAEERVKVQQWLGIQPGQVWTDQQHEDFANAMMASMAKGIYPREDLRPVFDRYSSWINDIYHTARDSWNVSEDIRKNMEGLLASGRLKEPAAAVPAQTLFQTEAMHGTAYDFEQFDPGMIGEGEGGASFGWGFYQTSKEGVARYYADLVQKRRTWGEGDYPGDVGGPVQRGHVYRQVLKTEIQRDNFMRWYEQPSEEQRSQILRAAADEKIFADRENRGYLLERFKQAVKQGTGEDLYKNLSLSLGSDRKASEFLNRAGIDGIQYPVGTVIGGNTARDSSKGWNYVVFDAGNIAIKEKMLFQPAEEAANKVFDDGLRKFIGGQLRSDEVIPVGQAGDILKAAGLDGEIRLRQSILKKAEAKHGVKAADLQDLPGYLNHPMAIFPSIKTPGASTIVTELTIGGAPVVAGIEAKKLGSGVEVLDVLTVHRRDPEQVLFWLAKFGKTIQPKFVDPQKVTAWLNEQAPSYQGRSLTKPLESLNSISNVAQDLLRGKGKDVLFQTDPHEEEVRKAVDRGMPVPDQVLQEYADRPWAKQETADRARLMEDARKVLDEQQFIQWKMDQAGSDAKPEAYYKAVWDASRRTPENPDVTINRFRSAMDEKTVARVMRVLTSDEIEQELAAQNVDSDGQRSVRQEIDSTLTQQMKDLGRRSREGKVDSALAARVKAQLDADPLTWKQFLDDSLPKRSHERSAEAELAADPLPALTDEEKALTVGGLDEEIRTLGDQVTAERTSIAEAQTRIQQEARPRRSKLTPQVRRELDKRYIAELKKRHAKEIAELKKRGGLVETKELLRLRKMEQRVKADKYLSIIFRPVTQGIADHEARLIEEIQSRLQTEPSRAHEAMLSRVREWRRQNPEAPLPGQLVERIGRSQRKHMSLEEMGMVANQVRLLRKIGYDTRAVALEEERGFIDGERAKVADTIRGGEAPAEAKIRGTKASQKEARSSLPQKVLWSTWHMDRIADMLDGAKPGPVKDWLISKINDATDQTITSLAKFTKANNEKLAELKIKPGDMGRTVVVDGDQFTRGELMGVYIYSQSADGLFALQTDDHMSEAQIQKAIAELTPQEKAYSDWMVDTLSTDQDFDRLQAVMLDVMNQRMERQDRYFPFQRKEEPGNNMIEDMARDMANLAGMSKKPKPKSGFLRSRMERKKGVEFPPLLLDAPAIFMDHLSKREFFINNGVLLKRVNRIFGAREVQTALVDKYGDKPGELIRSYVGNYVNPGINRAYESAGELSRALRANVGVSLIGANLFTIFKQVPDIPTIMLQAGPLDGMLGAVEFARNPRAAIEKMRQLAPQLKERSYDIFIDELKKMDHTAYQRVMRKVGEYGFVALKAMDTATNTIGFLAVYNKTMRQTGNSELAAKTARDFVLAKRPSGRSKDVADIYRRPGAMSWFLMFTSQQNALWNVLSYDIPTKFKAGLKGDSAAMIDAVLNAAALAVGAVGMGIIARKGVVSVGTTALDLLDAILGPIPFLGNEIEAGLRGQMSSGGINPFAVGWPIGKLGFDAANGDSQKVMTDLRNVLIQGAGMAGIPVNQLRRLYNTVDTGDPWELIGGPPKRRQ